jgi:hypothetical protein
VELSLFLYPCYSSFWEFFVSSMLILQMSNTRNHNNNNAENNNGENNQDVNPPPPPPPTLEQLLAMQAQMLQTMQQTMSTCKLLNLKRHHRHRGIGLEIFNALSHQPFLMLWSHLMLMIGSCLLRRSYKWCSATIVRRCCWPLTNFLVL